MTIRVNYYTRALTMEGDFHGVQYDHEIDTLAFDLPDALSGFAVVLELTDPTGTLSATESLTDGEYVIPNTVSCYPLVYYQLVATHADTRAWRSVIGELRFSSRINADATPVPLPDAGSEAARIALAAELTERGITTASDASWATIVTNVQSIP